MLQGQDRFLGIAPTARASLSFEDMLVWRRICAIRISLYICSVRLASAQRLGVRAD